MSVTTTGTLAASLQWVVTETEAATSVFSNTITDTGKVSYSQNFSTGTGLGQTNNVWHDQRVLPSGGTDLFDLTSLTQSVFNNSYTTSFSKIKSLVIRNLGTGIGDNIAISMTGANAWTEPLSGPTGLITIPPQSPFMLNNYQYGWTVDASNKNLQVHDVSDSGTGVTYHIAAIGLS